MVCSTSVVKLEDIYLDPGPACQISAPKRSVFGGFFGAQIAFPRLEDSGTECNEGKTGQKISICAMVKSRVFLGMGNLPPLIGNPGILIMGI